ncbi:MAG: VWA domain-containing protein [Pseudohongiellaceae bacterium]
MVDDVIDSESGNPSEQGLATGILNFARLLRRAGLPVGTGAVLDAQRAAALVGVGRRDDFYTCLFAQFVHRAEQRSLFDQAFRLYWHAPQELDSLHAMAGQQAVPQSADNLDQLSRRLADALGLQAGAGGSLEKSLELEIGPSVSAAEQLATRDFEAMSAGELRMAETMVKRLSLSLPYVNSRRFAGASARGRLDVRASLRASLRRPQSIPLRYHQPRPRPASLVVLCDISGSMAGYSRMFLHFMHAVLNARHHSHAFVFGTRLTNISRQLRHRDVDQALARAARQVDDWSGGTRISACLRQFNRHWSRRVLPQGAVVLLITDGLEQEVGEGLAREMERLRKSSKRLIWLNPLLRWDEFKPLASGIRTMLPFVDEFRPAHNIRSLVELAGLLSGPAQRPG